jgi:site-specific recombinase XerD
MRPAVDTSVRAFASHVHRTGSAATARKYEEAVTKFLKTLKHNGITKFESLPRNVLQQYVDTMIGSYAPSSVHVYLAGVRKYLEWVRNQGVILPDLADPETPKVPHRMRDSLSTSDMAVYFEQATELLPEPARTATILLPCTGLRAIEMSELPLSAIHKVSVQLEDGSRKNTLALRVIGKGDKERSVPILDEGVEALMSYLAGYRRKRSGPWVFPGMVSKMNKHGAKPMSVRLLRDAVARVREPLGMEITPHTMRRTYLTSLWRMGVDAPTIAKIAGHANIQTLFKHYLALDEQDVLRAVHSRGAAWG